jgi:hypothetical protein
LRNSGDSPRSRRFNVAAEATLVSLLLALLVTAAAAWVFQHGYILYWGDAQAHLNASRSLIDSRTPGYEQIGTPWLPLLHLICLPFVANDWLWSTGLAGTIPVAFCFVIAGTFFYWAARDAYGNSLSAIVVLACFALNPNVLYLASIPMTEIVFLAGLSVLLFSMLRFRATGRAQFLFLGTAASWSMSLTRFDGWFLIPFATLGFALFAGRRRWQVLVGFGLASSLAPLYWFAHSWWQSSNPLDFYNGPYSAAAIQGAASYPGLHNWPLALRYYAEAGRLLAGWALVILGAIGVLCAVLRKTAFLILFLLLPAAFLVWSLHSSKVPIFVPTLWPHSYYNTRYGIPVAVVAAFSVGAIVPMLPAKSRRLGLLLPVVCLAFWAWHASPDDWVCWKESQVNSVSRRAWTQAGANFLRAHYRSGQGILAGGGDIPGIFCDAAIPFREGLNIGNGPAWLAATSRPDLIHRDLWAIAQAGDFLSKALHRGPRPVYRIVKVIHVKGAPDLEIYRRDDFAAILRGKAAIPIEIITPPGELSLR